MAYKIRPFGVSCGGFWTSQKILCKFNAASTVTVTNDSSGINLKLLGNV